MQKYTMSSVSPQAGGINSLRKIFLTCVITAFALSGCTMLGTQDQTKPAPVMSYPETAAEVGKNVEAYSKSGLADVSWLLNYSHYLYELTQASLDEEYTYASYELSERKTAKNQLRMALLLNVQSARFYDRNNAISLLEEIIAEKAAAEKEMRAFAQLMLITLTGDKHPRSDFQALENRIKELQSGNQKLQEQLDALKAIEKSISERRKAEGTQTK